MKSYFPVTIGASRRFPKFRHFRLNFHASTAFTQRFMKVRTIGDDIMYQNLSDHILVGSIFP
ncbi:hypothetical protein D3C87_838700 [compost metagenome]